MDTNAYNPRIIKVGDTYVYEFDLGEDEETTEHDAPVVAEDGTTTSERGQHFTQTLAPDKDFKASLDRDADDVDPLDKRG